MLIWWTQTRVISKTVRALGRWRVCPGRVGVLRPVRSRKWYLFTNIPGQNLRQVPRARIGFAYDLIWPP